MAAIRHLGFVMCVFGPPRRAFDGLYRCANLVGIDAAVLIICMFFDFTSLAWKRLFAPQNVFWGIWPLNGGYLIATPKRH